MWAIIQQHAGLHHFVCLLASVVGVSAATYGIDLANSRVRDGLEKQQLTFSTTVGVAVENVKKLCLIDSFLHSLATQSAPTLHMTLWRPNLTVVSHKKTKPATSTRDQKSTQHQSRKFYVSRIRNVCSGFAQALLESRQHLYDTNVRRIVIRQ